MAAPATPTNVYLQQGNGQVYISADLSAGATSYPVLRSADGVTFSTIATPATPSYLDTSVSANTQYWYQMKASNSDGASVASGSQSIIPTLAGIMSLGALRLLSQQTADRVNSNFVTLPEWNTYINQSYFELYDMLVTAFEDYYLAAPALFVTSGNTAEYDLPNGNTTFLDESGASFIAKPFYKLMGVDLGQGLNNNAKVTIHKFDYIERNRYVYPNITSTFYGVFNLRYRILGSKIHFIPVPSSGQYVTLHYVPKLTQLLQDTDTVDGVSGWTEYIAVDAAIKALQKEESDTTALQVRKAALIKRIEETSMNRDLGQPDTISNTRGNSGNGDGFGPNGDGSFGGF